MMTVNHGRRLLLLVALCSSGFARSQEKPLWELGIGAAVGSFPAYRGSSLQHSYLLPFPFLVYRGERVSLDREGLRGRLFESPHWRLELSADAMVPVESDEGLRQGLPELAPMLELGPSLEYLIHEHKRTEFRLRLPLRAAIAVDFPSLATQGLVLHPNLAVSTHNDSWELGGSVGLMFASKGYHEYYYSVPAADVMPQRASYEAEGGYSGMRFTLGASRYFGRLWLGMFLRYDDLNGAVFMDSPLVEKNRAVMGGMALSWVFRRSATMVER
jgi:outer membrane scaffolding protein for murein synthesis (MipA/OmpV family)